MSISPIPGRTTAPIPAATMLGYQVEGARTNLCLQSNAFTTTWIVANTATGSIVQNVIGPDGGTTAWTLTDTDATAIHGVDISVGVLTAASYTFSVFIKKTSGATTYPVLLVYGVGSLWALATIDTNNGVATLWSAYTGRTIVGTAARCTSFNDDFWRAELVFTGSAVSYNVELLEAATETANKSTGTLSEVSLTGSAVFYGAQLELGSFASSYIPTTTIAVTRNADVLTYSSAGNIDGTKGWCYAEISTNWSVYPGSTHSAAGFGAATEGILSGGVSGVPTEIRAYDGTNSVTASGNPTMYLSPRKTAIGWGSSLTITQTGVTASGTFDGNIGTTAIGVGCSATGTQVWDGTIRNVRIGQRQLSASELGAITS